MIASGIFFKAAKKVRKIFGMKVCCVQWIAVMLWPQRRSLPQLHWVFYHHQQLRACLLLPEQAMLLVCRIFSFISVKWENLVMKFWNFWLISFTMWIVYICMKLPMHNSSLCPSNSDNCYFIKYRQWVCVYNTWSIWLWSFDCFFMLWTIKIYANTFLDEGSIIITL